jgi:thioredoxin reductase (NADPH)
MQDMMLDCLIIGGGPAGLTAAIYLGRYRRTVRVLDSGESRALKIPLTHNYAGFKGIGGPDLLARLREQAESFGTPVQTGRVSSLNRGPRHFTASVAGKPIKAQFVLLATGLVDVVPELTGKPPASDDAIRYCPICDGYEAMDRRVGVLGTLQDAGEKALFLRTYTRRVAVFTTAATDAPDDMRDRLLKAGIEIFPNEGPPEITFNNQVSMSIPNGDRRVVDVLYPALGCSPRSDLALSHGAARDGVGCLKVDAHQHTTVDGLYAAGDVVTDLHQLSVAIGHAAIAATAIHKRLPANPR